MTDLIADVRVIDRQNNTIDMIITLDNSKILRRKVTIANKLETVNDLALWIANQDWQQAYDGNDPSNDLYRLRLNISYSIIGVGIDADLQIDSLTTEPLQEDKGLSDINSLPNWATWSTTEAEDWIELNVTNLASAKVVLKALADMVIWERNILKAIAKRVL